MQLTEFKSYVESKIKELESMPYDGEEFPESTYEVEQLDGTQVERLPTFDASDYLDYCADVVRDVYIKAAAFGLDKEPPNELMSRDEALYYLRQVASFLGSQKDDVREQPIEMTIKEAATYLRMSPSNLRKIVARSRKQAHPEIRFHQAKPKARITLRREWLDDYLSRQSEIVEPKITRRKTRRKTQPQVVQSSHGLDRSLMD